MKILIACEYSGVVRDAFKKCGHDAWSCDFLPTEKPGQHFEQDVLPILEQNWDLLIAHPPCTFLCNSGVRWLAPGGVLNPARYDQMKCACDFFAALYWAKHIPKRAIENPVMHHYAVDYLAKKWQVPKFTQSFQPWWFGHGEVKRTCLHLVGLDPLEPTDIVSGREPRVHHASPGPDRWKNRSRTLPGVGRAMALQWGGVIPGSDTAQPIFYR
jgi:hypothetical protein